MSVGALLKQRTRWHQGFLQILRKGDWRRVGGLREQTIASVTLSFPLVAGLSLLLWPVTLANLLFFESPIWLTILATIPLYGLVAQLVFSLFGLFEMRRLFQIEVGLRQTLLFVVGFLPYQWLMGIAALRAMLRELRRQGDWEKTSHSGVHRVPTRVFEQAQPVAVRTETPELALAQLEQRAGSNQ